MYYIIRLTLLTYIFTIVNLSTICENGIDDETEISHKNRRWIPAY